MESQRLTVAQLKELRETFSLFDKNHDGVITIDELETVVEAMRLHLTAEEVKKMMTDADRNGDGCIEFSEFVLLMAPTLDTQSNASLELREAFDVFDKDKSGKITARELKQAMRIMGDPVTDEEASDIIREADWDGDGMISYEEFVATMANGRNPDQPSAQENGGQSEARAYRWGRKEHEGGEQKEHKPHKYHWGHTGGEHKEHKHHWPHNDHKEQGSHRPPWRW